MGTNGDGHLGKYRDHPDGRGLVATVLIAPQAITIKIPQMKIISGILWICLNG